MLRCARVLLVIPTLAAAPVSASFGGLISAYPANSHPPAAEPWRTDVPPDQLYPSNDMNRTEDVAYEYHEGVTPRRPKQTRANNYKIASDPTLRSLARVEEACKLLKESLAAGMTVDAKARADIDKLQETSVPVLTDASTLDELAGRTDQWFEVFQGYESVAVSAAEAAGDAALKVCNASEDFDNGPRTHAMKVLLHMRASNEQVVAFKGQFDQAFAKLTGMYQQLVGLAAAADQIRAASDVHTTTMAKLEGRVAEIERYALDIEAALETMQEQGEFLANREREIEVSMNRRAISIAPSADDRNEQLSSHEARLNAAFDQTDEIAAVYEEEAILFLESAITLRDDFDAVQAAIATMWKDLSGTAGSYTHVSQLATQAASVMHDM